MKKPRPKLRRKAQLRRRRKGRRSRRRFKKLVLRAVRKMPYEGLINIICSPSPVIEFFTRHAHKYEEKKT